MRTLTIAKAHGFDVRSCESVIVQTVISIDCHRKPKYSRFTVAVKCGADVLAEVAREWYGMRVPFSFGEVAAMVEECENKASADVRYYVSDNTRENTPDALALVCSLA